MKTIIEKIRLNPLLSVVTAILLGILVIQLSRIFGKLVTDQMSNLSLDTYTKNVSFKFFMLLLSLGFILILNNGSLKSYGFKKIENLKYLRFILVSTGIIIASFIIGNMLFNIVLRRAFPPEKAGMGFPDQSVMQMILTVWIWSSICEEVLTRGLIQGFINLQNKIKFLKLSLPVWVSGIFFGMMHLSLLRADMDVWFISFIVFNTTVLGLLAAYYREKTNSIYPAIFLHIWANIIGSLPMLLLG